jgi:hypothetical protein
LRQDGPCNNASIPIAFEPKSGSPVPDLADGFGVRLAAMQCMHRDFGGKSALQTYERLLQPSADLLVV